MNEMQLLRLMKSLNAFNKYFHDSNFETWKNVAQSIGDTQRAIGTLIMEKQQVFSKVK